ncbi:Alpha/Beta hydrolase protein [Elsinoe ampelina]|uniref:Alpha/Beta hydrolase protein n=1 Tax=Elsinoe ampelina TaxID=302913 RepID=A0A6A6GGS8_9PEZI|nr:Alpha/Beta hydrolase protein [Elsinoe ampelina]
MLILRRGPKSKGLLRRFLYAALRSFTANNTLSGDRASGGTTEDTYLEVAKKKGFQPDTLILKGGLKAHWLGNRGADRVLLYFHGGGYVLAAGPGHVNWVYRWAQEASKDKSTSALMLSYTLAPEGQYPTQLQQAAEVLNYLLTEGGKRPSQIIIGGDSAGGNLASALLCHLLHPHPEVEPVKLSEPLAGALLLSPWVEFIRADEHYRANMYNDMIGIKAARKWSSAFLGSAPNDNYTQPGTADASWFSGLPLVVSKIFVYGGALEVLIGSIIIFADKLRSAHPNVEFFVEVRIQSCRAG